MTEQDIVICGHGSGTPSTKRLDQYSESRYKGIAKNGKHKGLVAVRRCKALNTDELRQKFHDKYKTILGRNIYSQTLRAYCYKPYGGSYYSDCSSSGCLTLSEIGLSVLALNTAGIYQSSKFEDVPVIIKDGHIINPEVLKVGDALLYIGEDPSRPLQIGHVEWVYEINSSTKTKDKIKTGISDTKKVKDYKVKVTAYELNVRKTAGDGQILRTLKKDDVVTISKICTYTKPTGSAGLWGYVKRLAGWISLAYTTKDE